METTQTSMKMDKHRFWIYMTNIGTFFFWGKIPTSWRKKSKKTKLQKLAKSCYVQINARILLLTEVNIYLEFTSTKANSFFKKNKNGK